MALKIEKFLCTKYKLAWECICICICLPFAASCFTKGVCWISDAILEACVGATGTRRRFFDGKENC